MKGLAFALVVLTASLALPTAAQGATTVGQSPPAAGALDFCGTLDIPSDLVSLNSVFGNSYVIPSPGGVITSWHSSLTVGTSNTKLRIFQGGLTTASSSVTPLRETPSVVLTPGGQTTFNSRLAVAGGEVVGMNIQSSADITGCVADGGALSPENVMGGASPSGPLGAAESLILPANTKTLPNISANLEPDADADGFGDETQDAFIDKGPKKKTTKPKATFALRGAASYECRLDGKAFAQCASGVTFKRLKPKKHTFAVHAVTPAAELSPDATFSWKVKKKKKKK